MFKPFKRFAAFKTLNPSSGLQIELPNLINRLNDLNVLNGLNKF